MTVDELCSFIWWKMTDQREQKDIDQLRIKLWQPPIDNAKPIPVKSPWSAESEMKAFAALQAQLGMVPKPEAKTDPLAPGAR